MGPRERRAGVWGRAPVLGSADSRLTVNVRLAPDRIRSARFQLMHNANRRDNRGEVSGSRLKNFATSALR